MYPNITENEDYAGVINERHFARLQNYIDDAVAKGPSLRLLVLTRRVRLKTIVVCPYIFYKTLMKICWLCTRKYLVLFFP